MTFASRLGRRPVAVLGGLWIAVALLAFGQPGSGRGPGRPSEVLASFPVPPARPSCALLADVGTQEVPRLSGLALAGSGLDTFLSHYGGPSRIGRGITALNPAFCPVLDAVVPFATFQPNGPVRLRIDSRVPVGTTVKPSLQAPGDSVVTLDLFNAKNEVVHLLPRAGAQARGVWTAQAPIGQWLAVMFVSGRPLVDARPGSEPATPYLRALRNALRDTPDAMVDAVQIDVVAPAPSEEAAQRPECKAVTAINERAQTGEQLTNDERAILRACHR